jgi:hypothetical protein
MFHCSLEAVLMPYHQDIINHSYPSLVAAEETSSEQKTISTNWRQMQSLSPVFS